VNRDIQVVREAIVKLTQMLSDKGMRVTQQGIDAYVQSDMRTGKPIRVNLPFIPDNASEELILAIQGFLDHEVAHILFTDFKVSPMLAADGSFKTKEVAARFKDRKNHAIHKICNILEDTRIEREMRKRFKGSDFNLTKVSELVAREYMDPAVAKARATGTKEAALAALLMPIMRAWSGQSQWVDWMSDKWDILDPIVLKALEEFKDRLPRLSSTKECLEVATQMHTRLGLVVPPPPPREEPKEKKKPEKSDDEADGDPCDDGSPSDGDSDGDEGDEPGESDSDDEASETPDAPAEKPSEDDEAGKPDEKDTDAESDGKDEDDSEAATDEKDGDGSGDKEDEKEHEHGRDDTSRDESADEAWGDDREDDSDEDDSEGEGTDEADSGDEESDDDGEGDESSHGDKSDTGDGGADEGDEAADGTDGDADIIEKGADPILDMDAFDEGMDKLDFDDAAAKAIGEDALDAAKHADYNVFTRDYDRVEVFKPSKGASRGRDPLTEMENDTRHMIGVMQKDLERILQARSMAVFTAGHRTGRLHGASLHRLKAGDDRVFRRKQETITNDVAVSLLVDSSGSMNSCSRFENAMIAAYALSSTLERVKVDHEVLGFTTDGVAGDPEARRRMADEEYRLGRRFSRVEAIYMPIFKQFHERLTPNVKERFAWAQHEGGLLANNIDGECVEMAAYRLLARRAPRHVLMVLSDGEPCASGDRFAQALHLKNTVEKLSAMKVETIGIGIQTDSVKRFYPRNMVLNSVEDLPRLVMRELKRILTN